MPPPTILDCVLVTPGAASNNPFAADAAAAAASQYTATGERLQEGGGQYYGRGYSQAQSGYSASGLGKDGEAPLGPKKKGLILLIRRV